MYPWFVNAIQGMLIGPAMRPLGVHVAPPSREETKPTVSWQVFTVQELTGK
jgi:hypothetical protein